MILIVDTNSVAHRILHSIGPPGVAYGILRDVTGLMEVHDIQDVVFCFDKGVSHRRRDYPDYKVSRSHKYAKLDVSDQVGLKEMGRQVRELRDGALHDAGFSNVFACEGYEADDLIASVVHNSLPAGQDALIMSSDHDLFQLLDSHVFMYHLHRKKTISLDAFRAEWGVEPAEWPLVKAIAGCGTDDIRGVAGVKERTACKYLRGAVGKVRHLQAYP
jgi:DNA polymerase-1